VGALIGCFLQLGKSRLACSWRTARFGGKKFAIGQQHFEREHVDQADGFPASREVRICEPSFRDGMLGCDERQRKNIT